MFNRELFLGFPVDESFAVAMKGLEPKVAALFTQGGDEYLSEVIYQDMKYLGKCVGAVCDVDQLEFLETNIYSLLKKMAPRYPYHEATLVLFSISSDSALK